MKILVVGDGHSAIHEVAVVAAFKQLEHQVEPFYWQHYFNASNPVTRIWRRAQNKFLIGPIINKLNSDLIEKSVLFEPKLIFVYRGTHITPRTIIEIKRKLPHCVVYGYNNDNPFAEGHPPWLWRHFLKSVPVYDIVFAYRNHNLDDFARIGAKRVELLRSWFLPELHKTAANQAISFKSDCVFLGHYEADGRAECIQELILNDVRVKLFGPYKGLKNSGWDVPIENSEVLKVLLPVRYLTGKDYVEAVRSAPMALCFLSKLNKDTYTRRCFEIPAIGTALVSEYTDDLASLFIEGKEAIFFRNKQELVEKVKYYLAHPKDLDAIRTQGNQRVLRDRHDIYSRLNLVVKLTEE